VVIADIDYVFTAENALLARLNAALSGPRSEEAKAG
jgi:hypothetical protein